ncbi:MULTISPECIES: DUF3558 family protein [unclassified Saccharopolyspora]|uniref:DUF3558 family protein n=1 Tax=unclassified Saccharopolyspora TaxID=2646250 RepID=UPI001CD39447|nr:MULTISPECIES: DUF3558 family protein [unclassified Saccharopolyspora]MCA1185524.1 DUF3558 domain-containing protein [Saccharopolyspora sp. 6T]MCA1283627.1 DUF3558 domain-containing protein [Saccharopolyspora sp. 7B]
MGIVRAVRSVRGGTPRHRSATSRVSVAALSGVGLVALTSCALGGPDTGRVGPPEASPVAHGANLSQFDPCNFFKREELTANGLPTEAKDFTLVSFQPGCAWSGEKFDLAFQKNADETVDSLSKGAWDEFTRIQIGGREAARVIPTGAKGQGFCNTVVNAGGGVVLYQFTAAMRDTVADPCGEIEKIAEQTASRLPE